MQLFVPLTIIIKKMMKKVLKIIGYILLAIITVAAIAFFKINEKKPVGVKGDKAEALAQKMMQAVNKLAWDSTAIVGWTYRGNRHHIWDKQRNLAQVTWDNHKVLLNLNTLAGKVYDNQEEVRDADKAEKLKQEAYKYFINDAFWLNPIAKMYDAGVERSIVTLSDGTEGLLVSYSLGGLTPGDAYLWRVGKNGIPTSWKLWVKIIPIGGMELSWDNWQTLSTGAKVAASHTGKLTGAVIPLTDIKAAKSLSEMGLMADAFEAIQ